jgi:AcrR family transcriptional regulator
VKAGDGLADDRPPRRSRRAAQERTRERLLDAAAAVLVRKGYAGASVEEIAEAAGFSTGAVYSNFAGKEALFNELLLARNTTRMHEVIDVVLDPSLSGQQRRARLAQILTAAADGESDAAMLQAEIWLYAMRRPDLHKQVAEQVGVNRDALAQALSTWASDHGRPGDMPFHDLATVLVAMFQGLIQLRRTDAHLVPDQLYAAATRWLIDGITRTYEAQ